uniref:Uncharacterized protein n=1 Tax=Romanomermis culicivorax TaxID=13658 RepID=A0A915KS36_ROMCU
PNLPENLDFYDFEGENYRKYQENDRNAFDELVSKQIESTPKAERRKKVCTFQAFSMVFRTLYRFK